MVSVAKEENPEQYMYTPEELQEKLKGNKYEIQLNIFHEITRKLKL